MIKVHYQDDHDQLLELSQGHMTTLIEPGVKKAESCAFPPDVIARHAPDKDHFMLHVVAMGDYETYGPNKNGDAFAKAANQKYHPTFVSDGHFYREHRNRDPKTQGIGHIKASAHNEEMGRVELLVHGHKKKAEEEYEMARDGKVLSVSMSCFPAGQKVLMADGSLTPIEDVREGDRVRTHEGNVGAVSRTMNKFYTGAGMEARAYGVPFPITSTEDHPIWARKSRKGVCKCPVCGGHFNVLGAHLWQKKDPQHQKAYREFEKSTEGFWPAHSLAKGDTIRIPVDKEVKDDESTDRAWLLGLFVADGHIQRGFKKIKKKSGRVYKYPYTRVDINLHEDEVDIADRASKLLEDETGNKSYVFRPSPSSKKLVVRSTVTGSRCGDTFIEWFEYHGGHLAGTKRFSEEAMHWPPETQKHVLAGWIDGDGTWNETNSRASGVTVSEVLSFQLQMMAARCGVAVTSSSHKRDTRQRSFQLQFSNEAESIIPTYKMGSYSTRIGSIVPTGQLKNQKEGATAVRAAKPSVQVSVDLENGHLYARLRYVKTVFLDERVYDLTIPGDHGFVVNGIGVSNCRVPEDRCSICNHKAASRFEYCDHLKDGMLQYFDAFDKYAFAFNDDPTFFDISRVRNPADRIAHYLEYQFPGEKAAHADRIITGSEWAEFEGLMDEGPAVSGRKLQVLQKLASEEAWWDAAINDPSPKSEFAKLACSGWGGELTNDELTGLRQLDSGTMFRKLASRKILLPFGSFCAWVKNAGINETMESDLFKQAAGCLPSMFRVMLKDPSSSGMSGLCEAGSDIQTSYHGGGQGDLVQKIMDSVSDRFSTEETPVRDRVIMISMKEASDRPKVEVSKTCSSEAEGLALAYGHYKVSALTDMLQYKGLEDADYLHAVAQNRVFEI